jgi:tRNA(Ile)-lysidine synthetase-like protein
MFLQKIAQNLKLAKGESRRFVVSVSGGVDSMLLLWAMNELRKEYSFSLSVFHMNFGLRGTESDADEKLVEETAKKLKLPCHIRRIKIEDSAGVQEAAREARIKLASEIEPGAEWVEAHHADDQVETFMFRLLRGSGLSGLECMAAFSERGGRKVWRPFLSVTKAELRELACENAVPFREDVSNQTPKYDRNWIRLELLPMIRERFPHAANSILKLIDQITAEEADLKSGWREVAEDVLNESEPLSIDWDKAKLYSEAQLNRFIHGFFWEKFSLNLSRKHIVDLSQKIGASESFSLNWPGGIIVRGRQKSGTVPRAQIMFYNSSKGTKTALLRAI